MPAPAAPKHTYAHGVDFVRIYDVDWAGGALTMPHQVTSPRTAVAFNSQVFPATTDISTPAAFDANYAARTHVILRSPEDLWTNHMNMNGSVLAAGPLQLLETLGKTSVNLDADYQVLPTGMSYAAAAPAPVIGLTEATISRLRKTGFSPRSARTLGTAASAPETVDWKAVLRRGDLSYRQMKTLRDPAPHTMSKLLRGGFTRHQAKLILGG